ncbi:septal ring lytic transglycosylase RlpA family protein [Pedobacter sp. HMF7647]|uniref:Probable endolytic peptidoglycan transglycosylase RlpA n=1 Tax=Hufsiella arboris TaxID=2695275 RepID=A0A7K1Y9U3_9SPHI|nr:septal ring lytic transglycosylase RlpA family protein [Hufsiella arboris]MXV50889.1 septal ring lytic transglycosylase RlpA family protein [Hufsiella arboris]
MFAFVFFLATLVGSPAKSTTRIDSIGAESKIINNESYSKFRTGKATYYASYFEGRRTTSGEHYRHKKFTAAHRTLPLGTIVTVTNPYNGKSVDVKINDRGPYNRRFLIDLSQSAAREIGIYGRGVGDVTIAYQLPN